MWVGTAAPIRNSKWVGVLYGVALVEASLIGTVPFLLLFPIRSLLAAWCIAFWLWLVLLDLAALVYHIRYAQKE